jgi:small subunit ribosomal protein S7
LEVRDPGLKEYVNLDAKLVLKSHGRNTDKFGNMEVNVIERFINLMQVPGHRGKKHKVETKWATGKYYKNTKNFLKALEIIKKKTGKNPVQVLINAIENSAPRDEVTTVEYGGARYPQAVDVSPLRRLNLSLRWLVHGGYDNAHNKKTKIYEGIAKEILDAANSSKESLAIQKKIQSERQADSAR